MLPSFPPISECPVREMLVANIQRDDVMGRQALVCLFTQIAKSAWGAQ